MDIQTTPTNNQYIESSNAQKPVRRPHVVIIGGGFGGLSAAKTFYRQQVDVTLIDRNNFHLFQPMLYQVATAGLSSSNIAAPLREILRGQANTEVLMDEVTGIDKEQQQVITRENLHIPYDYLIIATGATNNYFQHNDWAALAPGMKSLEEALVVRSMVLEAFEAAERHPGDAYPAGLLTFVLVGGGPTGVELAGAIAELARMTFKGNFRHIKPDMARIILVEGEPEVIPTFSPALTRSTRRKLQKLGVEVYTGVHVELITPDGVMIGDKYVETQNVIWTAGVKASPAGQWLNTEVDRSGRVKVRADLTIPGYNNIFVIGDTALANENGKALPGVAQVALQQGQYAAQTILARTKHNDKQRPFHYSDKGMMATVGRAYSVVDLGALHYSGLIGWITWIVIHIYFLIGFRNRLIVMLQYAWNYFTYQRGARVILQKDIINRPKSME